MFSRSSCMAHVSFLRAFQDKFHSGVCDFGSALRRLSWRGFHSAYVARVLQLGFVSCCRAAGY